MDEREYNLRQIELRKDAADLLMYAVIYDKRKNEKPGEFFNRVKNRLQYPSELRAEHFSDNSN